MPAREIRDSQLGSTPESPGLLQAILSPVQIKADERLQKVLVDVVIDDFEKAKSDRDKMDLGSSSKGEKYDFDSWMTHLKDLYHGNREAKTVPWKFCSNRSLRIGTAILEMLHARLFGAVWNEDLLRWRPGETTDVPKAERVTKFMDWWLRVWAPAKGFFDNWVKVTAGFGDSLTETSWVIDEYDTGRFREQPIVQEDGNPVINENGDLARLRIAEPRKIERTESRVISKENVYFFSNASDVQRDPIMVEEEILYKDLEAMERSGNAVNVTGELAKYLVVTMPQGDLSPEESARIRHVKIRNIPVRVIRWYGHYDVDGVQMDQSVRLMVAREHQVYLGGVRMRDITRSGMRPIEFAKYGSYIDKPDILFGEGVLDQVKELSDEIDAVFNQMTDGNTLSVMRPGFYDPSGDLDAGAISLAPNRLTPVSDPSRNVYFPDFRIDTARLIDSIRLVMEFIERLTAASSYVMGKESEIVGGSGTATRTQAIMQSAEVRFTRPAERLKEHAGRIVTQHLDLIQRHLPPGFETRVLGEKGEPIFQQGELTDAGLTGQFDAYLVSDPALGSKATERELASMLYSLLLQNIIVGTDPVKIYKVTADLLKSYGKDPVEYLGPGPKADDIDDPEDENTLMLQGDFGRVRANMTENHILHLQKHMELPNSPTLQMVAQTAPELVNQILAYNQQHMLEHQMMLQAMMALIQKVGGGGGGGDSKRGEGSGEDKGGAGDAPEQGMENMQGPLAAALDQKRAGEVASTP